MVDAVEGDLAADAPIREVDEIPEMLRRGSGDRADDAGAPGRETRRAGIRTKK
jgi:hypothetical protein